MLSFAVKLELTMGKPILTGESSGSEIRSAAYLQCYLDRWGDRNQIISCDDFVWAGGWFSY